MKYLYLYYSIIEKDIYLGKLEINNIKGKEIFSFTYDKEFLNLDSNFILDPTIDKYIGVQYPIGDIFPFINDLIPDSFGKLLINKYEEEQANKEKRSPRKLLLSDYLINVNDLTRIGAIRIKEDKDGEFISNSDNSVPPYVYLRKVQDAYFEYEEKGYFSSKEIERLLLPGSSLGGARPKGNIYFNDELYIAKFPSKKDEYDVEAWEYLSLELAKLCNINVPEIKLENFSPIGSTLLIKRFDRNKNERIHYLSLMSILNAKDGDNDFYSYLDIVSMIKSYCYSPKEDLIELFKRLMFSYLINNLDNHLRNIGFLYNNKGFYLCPLFDVNPCLYISSYSLGAISNKQNIELNDIVSSSYYYDLKEIEALEIYKNMKDIIQNNIKKIASKLKIKQNEINIFLEILKNK